MHSVLTFALFFALVALVYSQQSNSQNSLRCGFTCTRQASFRVNIDGTMTTASCTDNAANPKDRCFGCCQARALAAGLTIIDATGFPSTNGQECICCFFRRCN